MVLKLDNRVAVLEKSQGTTPIAIAGPEPNLKETEEDDDVDLFGSDSDSEDDAEKGESYERFVRKRTLAKYQSQSAVIKVVMLCFTVLK